MKNGESIDHELDLAEPMKIPIEKSMHSTKTAVLPLCVISLVCLFPFSAFAGAPLAPSLEEAPTGIFSTPTIARQETNSAGYQLISDPDTYIEAVSILVPYSDDPFLADLMKVLRSGIKVIAVVPSKTAANEVWRNLRKEKISRLAERLQFVVLEGRGKFSRWGRDPYIVLRHDANQSYALVNAIQKGNARINRWEDRSVRSAMVENNFGLPNVVSGNFERIPTWILEGGAITADDRYAYVGKGTIAYMQKDDDQPEYSFSETQVVGDIENIISKKILVLASQDLHSDRFHMPVGKTALGERTSMLADPVRALEIIAGLTPEEKLEAVKSIQNLSLTWQNEEYIETEEGQNLMARLLQRVNENSIQEMLNIGRDKIEYVRQSLNNRNRSSAETTLKDAGITVVRLPVLNRNYIYKQIVGDPPHEQEQLKSIQFPISMAYTNIIQDFDGKHHTAIIPKYGIKKLDDEVLKIYKSLRKFDRIYQIASVREGVGDGGPRCRLQVFGRRLTTHKKNKR